LSGIAALIDVEEDSMLEIMLEKIRHRGLEGEEIYRNGRVQLGEVNFESEDTSSGLHKSYGVILDGEPRKKGRTMGKKELLGMYLDKGPDFVREVEGRFAVIISGGQELFAARDVFGIKPLYYLHKKDKWYFASEIKALVDAGEEVEEFPPGHYFYKGKMHRFGDIPRVIPTYEKTLEESIEELRELLLEAVREAVDIPLKTGTFLSGGVDSSIIALLASRYLMKEVPVFVAGMEGSPDLEKARSVAEYLGVELVEHVYTPAEMWKILPEVIYHLESFDVELVNSSIANYFASRLARSHGVKVILSGEGADELFGGYHYLKKYRNNADFATRLEELLRGMHNGGFQRVDRMSKAHTLEVEMPFMHPAMVKYAAQLPPGWKISSQEMGKWILRLSFDGELPENVLWRRKEQFGIGSGTEEQMRNFVAEQVPEEEFERALKNDLPFDFKSRDEYCYYRVFEKFYPSRLARGVNRWLV